MRAIATAWLAALALAVSGLPGCAGSVETPPEAAAGSPPTEAPPAPPPVVPGEFRGERAIGHLRGLVAIGPRVAGTSGAEAAVAYVRRHLEAAGHAVEARGGELPGEPPIPFTNLSVTIPGTAGYPPLLLATPLDTAPAEHFDLLGANEGASGAALLLELARVVPAGMLAHTVELHFLGAELRDPGHPWAGTRLLEERAASARAFVYLHQLADRDLDVRRDLVSQRVLRDTFFGAAARLGLGDAFVRDAPFDQVPGGHRWLFDRGIHHVVALSDTRYGGDMAPGSFWRTAEDDLERVSEESLGAAGRVVVAGLRDLSALLERVDAHVRVPAPAEEEPAGAPGDTRDDSAEDPDAESVAPAASETPASASSEAP